MSCLNCDMPRYDGPRPVNADDFLCRECQRSPALQMRFHLTRARASGMDFERAWMWSWERVRWPHATAERQEWKRVVDAVSIRGSFRRHYLGEQDSARVVHLDLVA